MNLPSQNNMLSSFGGGDYMGGSYHWHEPAKRFFISVYWDGKRNKIWRYTINLLYKVIDIIVINNMKNTLEKL